jgi:putative ABC transport system permease protein
VLLRGTYSLGYPALDENLFFIDLASAQELLRMSGEASRLVVSFNGSVSVPDGVERLEGLLADMDRSGPELAAYQWRAFVKVVVQAVEADTAGFSVIIVVLYLLIIVGILNSMSMAVQERTREVGTLRAIGMKRRQLRVLFLAEGVSVAIIGAAAGSLLAGVSAIHLGGIGFDLSVLAGTGLPIPFGERFTADFRVVDFLLAAGVAILSATAGTLLPVRRASHLRIADALGSHLE